MNITLPLLRQLIKEVRVGLDRSIPEPRSASWRVATPEEEEEEYRRMRAYEIADDAWCCPNEYGIPKGVFGDNYYLVLREYGDAVEAGKYEAERELAVADWFQNHGIGYDDAVILADREPRPHQGPWSQPGGRMMSAAIKFAKHEKLAKRHGPGGSRTIPDLSTSRMPMRESKKPAITTSKIKQLIKEELDKILNTN